MDFLPDTWNELLDWLCATPRSEMSEHMWAARQVTLFHGEVCNGGLYDKLAYGQDEYPHGEILSSYAAVCDEATVEILREGLLLLARPSPDRLLPDEARGAYAVATDQVSRGAPPPEALQRIESALPECPGPLRALAYQIACENVRHFALWETLDATYFAIGDRVLVQVAKYAESFQSEWQRQNLH